jgi:uncharacterized protein YlxP (DUF503 family)
MTIVGLRSFDVHIQGSQSLKEKRFVLKSVKDRISKHFNVSIAETGHLDKWQRTEIAVAVVSGQRRNVEKTLDAILDLLDGEAELRVIEVHTEIY